MTRYWYSLVRCVPDPRTGEFVNVGAIAGDPVSGDWSIRQVSNESRVRRLAGAAELEAVHGFLARVGLEIDQNRSRLEEEAADPLGESWLQTLFHDHRNVVQLSPPTPMVADDAEQALELLFDQLVIDPVTQPRSHAITKHRIVAQIREAYQASAIDVRYWRPRAEIHVGSHLRTQLDFAVGNGKTVQLTQGWSFQRTGLEELSTQVKAWGYALQRLRENEPARIIAADGAISSVDADVDLEVVVAPPLNAQQTEAYEESAQVFAELNVSVRDLGDVGTVGRRAAELLHSQ